MTRTKARRGTCRHMPRYFPHYDGIRDVVVMAQRCVKCFEFVPLGPANDGGEHAERVAVEKRAAEIADELATGTLVADDYRHLLDEGLDNSDEGYGWFFWDHVGRPINEHLPMFQAGYLARVIAQHKDESP